MCLCEMGGDDISLFFSIEGLIALYGSFYLRNWNLESMRFNSLRWAHKSERSHFLRQVVRPFVKLPFREIYSILIRRNSNPEMKHAAAVNKSSLEGIVGSSRNRNPSSFRCGNVLTRKNRAQ